MAVSSRTIQQFLDAVSGGNQPSTTVPVGGRPSPGIYLLPPLPQLPGPVISPPEFQENPDL